MPNEEEIRKIMAKAKKAAGGKGPPQKKGKGKTDSGGTKEKSSKKEEKVETPEPSPEITELKSIIVKQNENIAQQNQRIAGIENFLKEAQKQAQTQMANQTGQGTSQEKETQEGQADQGKEQREITPEQELAMLQQAQQQAQQGQQPDQEGQVPAGPGNPLHIYLLGKTMDMVGKVLPPVLAKRGGGGEGEGGGNPLRVLADKLLIGLVENTIAGRGGGGNNAITLDQLKAFTDAQKVLAAGIFDTIKGLPKPTGQEALERLVGTRSPTEEPLK